MKRFHYNKQTGLVGKCSAVRKCPFGDLTEDHYPTAAEAARAYETTMMPALLPNSKWDRDLKTMDSNELAQEILSRVAVGAARAEQYDEVLELSSFLHAKQRRRNRGRHSTTPYIEHPLRVSLRLMRAGVTDETVWRASLLHDTVEDGALVFHSSMKGSAAESEAQARKILSAHITKHFGKETSKTVLGVTNPLEEEGVALSAEEKNKRYREHLEEAVRSDPRVLLVKLSDFVDNAGSLHHTDLPGSEHKTRKQAVKYLPCVRVFQEELSKPNPFLPEGSRAAFLQQLDRMEERLVGLVEKYKDLPPEPKK